MRHSLAFLCIFSLGMATVAQKAPTIRPKDAVALYACADTVLHKWPETSPSAIGPRFWTDFVDAGFVPKLQPLRIIRVIDAGRDASGRVFVVVLRDPAGTEFWDEFHLSQGADAPSASEAARALQAEPLGLYSLARLRVRASMMKSIRMGFVERGMTAFEATCAAGDPQEQNDLGLAGEQWVFDNGKLMVYIQNGRVVDVQQIN